MNDTLRASSISLCLGVSHLTSAHPNMHKNREWGGRRFKGHHMLHVRPTRASYIGISQQWRAFSRDGNSVTPAQVTSIQVKDKSFNLTALAKRNSSDDIQSFKVSGSDVYSTITCAIFPGRRFPARRRSADGQHFQRAARVFFSGPGP